MAITKIQSGALPADVINTAAIDDASITHAKLHTDMDLTGKTVQVATPTANPHATTKLYVDTAIAGAGGGADLYAANESSPSAQPSATGANAIAIGDGAISAGAASVALSKGKAHASNSFATNITNNSTTYGGIGTDSIVMGKLARANSTNGIAIGTNAYSNYGAVVIGYNSYTSANSGVAIGYDVHCGYQALTLGFGCSANGNTSIAIGRSASAGHTNSASFGKSVSSTATNQVNIGGSTQDVRISETYTLPKVDGSANQTLTTDGSGVVSWATPSGGPTFKTFGTDSIMIGDDATGTINAANYNTGLGVDIFAALTTGSQNTAVGYRAGYSNTTGGQNTAVGESALFSNTIGTYNTGIGREALLSNTIGYWNVAIGRTALASNTSGDQNTAIGGGALQLNTTADANTAVGYQAGYSNTTGQPVTAMGYYTLNQNTTGVHNNAYGYRAMRFNTTGSYNTSLGSDALYSNTTASYNTAVGNQALYNSNRTTDANGFNTAIGHQAGYQGSSGQLNTYVGQSSGYYITTGSKNTILGCYTGNNGGLDIRNSSNNTVLSDGDGNVRLHINEFGNASTNGTFALNPTFSTTTSMNDVLRINSSSTGSTGVGHGSAIYFLGERNDGNTQAMAKIGSIASTNSGTSFASDLVFHAGPSGVPVEKVRITSNGELLVNKTATLEDCRMEINHGSRWGLILDGDGSGTDNHIMFTRSGGTRGYITSSSSSVSYNTSSDYRLKENVVDLTGASARVNQLNPSRFNFIADGTDTVVDGFLAHEVATVVPEAITGTHNQVKVWKEGEELPDGASVGDNKLDDDGNTIPIYQGIDQSKLVPLLTAALQEALTEIASLKTRVQALEE